MRQRLGDQRKQLRKSRVTLQRPVARQRSNPGRPTGRTNAGEILDPIDVDQNRWSSQAKIHRRYQALSASQKFRVIAVFCLEHKRVLERGGGDIFEGSRLHGARVEAIKTRSCALKRDAALKV